MADSASAATSMGWRTLPRPAQIYAAATIAAGAFLFVAFLPLQFPQLFLFTALLVLTILTSTWKVNLLVGAHSTSTLSVSYAANLMALLLLGPHHAMVVAAAGVWAQCVVNVRRPYPAYRTIFSVAAEIITMQATGWAYVTFGGSLPALDLATLSKPVVCAIATYFVVNTGLVAIAIALSSRQAVWSVWSNSFLWSAPSFMVAGGGGALAAVLIARGNYWPAVLLLAPVYLTYRTYRIFLSRIEDARRHTEETRVLHEEALEALLHATAAERALADEKERLAVTLRSIGDGVITTDLEGSVLLMNSAAERLTGWTQADVHLQPLSTVFPIFDRVTRRRYDHPVPELIEQRETAAVSRSALLVSRDLTERPIEEFVSPLQDAEGRAMGLVVAFRDITDALRVQEERARADKLTSLGLLAGGIAHDFNNILMGMVGHVSLAQALVPQDSPAAHALVEAERSCAHARQLTWQLLTFSKGGVPNKQTVALPKILKDSAHLVLRGSNVTCTFHFAPELWSVTADTLQLVQVFTNILLNAQQAMPHGGSIQVSAENVSEGKASFVKISISDTGIGIPKENLGSIFDPYFSTKQRGCGLGLASSHSIIKNHGGHVSVESTLGQGTMVCVSLPAASHHELDEMPEPLRITHGSRSRVLVMDDEATNRTLTANMLKFLGYDAEVVSNGSAVVKRYARAMANGEPFDTVILDLIVPGNLGGREAIQRLARIDPSVNAILVSGYAQDDTMTDFRSHGFKAALPKPFTLEELSRTLQSLHH
jgi:PAS domain S-box-containing protein